MPLKFNLIVAKTEGNGIGYKGRLPWTLRKELAHFTTTTKAVQNPSKQNAVIMGRITWESLPDNYKPLPGRLNVVLSRKKLEVKEGVISCLSLEETVEKLSSPPLSEQIETSWIIGGAKLYESAIATDLVYRIYLTNIMQEFPCDTYVNLDLTGFAEVTDPKVPQEVQEENGVKYTFKVYEKINSQ